MLEKLLTRIGMLMPPTPTDDIRRRKQLDWDTLAAWCLRKQVLFH